MRTLSRRQILSRSVIGLLGAALPTRSSLEAFATHSRPSAETVVLGMMVTDGEWLERIAGLRSTIRIRETKNRVILDALLRLYDAGRRPVDLVVLKCELQRHPGRLTDAGGDEHLVYVVSSVLPPGSSDRAPS